MKAFDHVRPPSLAAALDLLPQGRDPKARERTRLVAGGQDIYTELKERLIEPELLVDLKGIGADGLTLSPDGSLSIGALATLAQLEEHSGLRERFAVLHEAAGSVASTQIRTVGTVGGNLCQRPRCWYYRHPDAVCIKKGGSECFAYGGLNKYNAVLGGGPSYIVHPSDLAPALVARLKLDAAKLAGGIEGVRQVAQLPDPLGVRQLHRELDQGLMLERVSVPLGVLGVIFEARPDAVMQIASLAIRSGNGAMLKGGREASRSCAAILEALRAGLATSAVDPAALELLTSREESLGLLKLDGLVDLIIPRGSNELVRFIQDNTRIPVLGHADGICHLYVDREVDIDQALRIAIDAKTQYPAACNAIETLLLHREAAPAFLAAAVPAMAAAGVSLRGDAAGQRPICTLDGARPTRRSPT